MFSGVTTLHDIIEGKQTMLLGVGKGWSYYMIWWKEEIKDSWKIQSQADQDGDRMEIANAYK